MCGIAGIFRYHSPRDGAADTRLVQQLNGRLRHRGPDAEGIWAAPDGRCTLGHRRLSILDLEPRSNQPMKSASGRYVTVFNGEIYNYRELRQALLQRGVRFRTESDTEALLEGFEHWGSAVFERADGMFAAAFYDTCTGTLVLARDRAGEKPLYVAHGDGWIAFASEYKPLLSLPGSSRPVSHGSLYEYFTLRYVACPNTLHEGITGVQPGTFQTWQATGQMSEHSYFALEPPAEPAAIPEEEYLPRLEDALVNALRTRVRADVPLGAFLSSGVDSSLVCSLAARELHLPLQCFSAGFADADSNETGMARQIAQHLDLPCTECLISRDSLLDFAGRIGPVLDEPNGDRSCVPVFFLSQMTRQHVTVALSGDGGDELFGGYGRYAALRGRLPAACSARELLTAYWSSGLPVLARDALDKAHPGGAAAFHRRVLSRFLPLMAREDLDLITRLRWLDFYSYLPGAVLAKVDRMSMRHALEVRTPFFSPEVLSLSAQLPKSLCADGLTLKRALRKLLSQYLPPSLIQPGKQGFGMPASLFRAHAERFEQLAQAADERLEAWEPFQSGAWDFAVLRAAARANINSLWAWIALGQWVDSLPRPVVPATAASP